MKQKLHTEMRLNCCLNRIALRYYATFMPYLELVAFPETERVYERLYRWLMRSISARRRSLYAELRRFSIGGKEIENILSYDLLKFIYSLAGAATIFVAVAAIHSLAEKSVDPDARLW